MKKQRVLTKNYRVQAQILNLPNRRILWINTYFPTDPHLVGEYDDTELQELLAEVDSIINSSSFTDLVWGSDLNWDIKRKTYFASRVKEFVDRLGLAPLWAHHSVDYTHVHTDNKSVATLDHFLVSPRLLDLVGGCGALHRGDNFSRHAPILLTLNLGALPLRENVKKSVPRKPAWSKATEDNIQNYTTNLEARLETLNIPNSLLCQDPHCSDQTHIRERDSCMLENGHPLYHSRKLSCSYSFGWG